MNTSMTLPDIAAQTLSALLPLEWVGIAQPVRLLGQCIAFRVSAWVRLDDSPERGIHMSRLYLALVTPCLLDRVLAGWKGYPFTIEAYRDDSGQRLALQVEVGYSSTCPCSAALARQLIQQRFTGRALEHAAALEWPDSSTGILATPHCQRSTATLRVILGRQAAGLPLLEYTEATLGTALQTAVKRADEQAFALANGQSPMFCEDAARPLHLAVCAQPGLDAFSVRVVHAKSLHAHDAVAESRWSREAA